LHQDGRVITPPEFFLAWGFAEGLARVATRNGMAFIDTTGEMAIPTNFDDVRDFSEGLAPGR